MAEKRSGQANVPLSPSDEDVLHALAFLRRTSKADVLGPVVGRFLHAEAKRPAVQRAVEALRLADGAQGTVTSLSARRRAAKNT